MTTTVSTTMLASGKRANWRAAIGWLMGLPPAYGATVLLLLGAAWLRPNLLSPMLLLLILRQAVPLGLAVLGQSLVMRGRSLDLSSGGVIAAVAYLLTSGVLPWDAPWSLLACMAFGLLVGAINGLLVVRVRASSVIVTLSVSMILSGLVIAASQFRSPGEAPAMLRDFAVARVAGVPVSVLAWLGGLIPLAWFLRVSVFGRSLDAIGASPRAAQLSGLPHLKVVFITHVLSAAMSVCSGLVMLGAVGVGSANLGQDLALNSLAAAILGGINFGHGKGGMWGPMVAAFMLAFLFNFLTSLGLGEAGRLMLQGAIIGTAALAYSWRLRSAGGH
ncbi:ABC transporter permease [Aquabacterium sp.]|uniref:ABC transporter permease n=1 Tax=Aquabacterium sp. TaxID=1872578 RepID=UPI004037C794